MGCGRGRAVFALGWRSVRKKQIEEHPECAGCGYVPIKGANDVHHIIPRHAAAHLANEPTNVCTLCRRYKCHLRKGHFGNYRKYWNPNIKEVLGNVGARLRKEELEQKNIMLEERRQGAKKSRKK